MSAEPKSGSARVQFVNARDCGHRMWWSDYAASGIDWCETCRMWRGVIVTRVDVSARAREAGAQSPEGSPREGDAG